MKNLMEQDSHSEVEETLLTDGQKEQLQLVRYALHLSQGAAGLQGNIVRVLGKMGELDLITLKSIPFKHRMRYLTPPKAHEYFSEKDLHNEAEFTWTGFLVQLDPARLETTNIAELEDKLLDGMISGDLHFQSAETPRLGRKQETFHTDSDNDPHASHIRRYILKGEAISPSQEKVNTVYRRIFTALQGKLLQMREERDMAVRQGAPIQRNIMDMHSLTIDDMTKLETKWEQNHPGESFFPSTGE